jgi:hypothetical protein
MAFYCGKTNFQEDIVFRSCLDPKLKAPTGTSITTAAITVNIQTFFRVHDRHPIQSTSFRNSSRCDAPCIPRVRAPPLAQGCPSSTINTFIRASKLALHPLLPSLPYRQPTLTLSTLTLTYLWPYGTPIHCTAKKALVLVFLIPLFLIFAPCGPSLSPDSFLPIFELALELSLR